MLSRLYPTLTARIATDGRWCEFEPVDEHDHRLRFVDGSIADLRREIRDLRQQDRDAARLIITRSGGRSGTVALCVNHALFDFPSFGFLFNRLWQTYTKICTGNAAEMRAYRSPPPSLPTSPERIIENRWLRNTSRVPDVGLDSLKSAKNATIAQDLVELESHQTKRLVEIGRRRSLSIHSLVCSAILLALRDLCESPGEEFMLCRSAVNLRNRLTPSIRETETTVLQAIHEAEVGVPFNGDLFNVGNQIKKNLTSSLEGKSLKMMWERSRSRSSTSFEKRLSQVTISNWGALPTLDRPPNLKVTDRLKCCLDGERASWIGRNPIYVLGTYENKLKVIGVYSAEEFKTGEISDVNDRIVKSLTEV